MPPRDSRVPLVQGVVGWSTQGGPGKLAVQMSQELSWCMQGGLVELITITREEQPTTSACLQPGVQGYSYVYGVEYETYSGPLSAVYEHNVPCAVCSLRK